MSKLKFRDLPENSWEKVMIKLVDFIGGDGPPLVNWSDEIPNAKQTAKQILGILAYCCPKCGEQIGWIGRFFQFLRIPLHKCYDGKKKPYKPKIVVTECGASRWVNVNEYFMSDEGREFLKEMSEFAKLHIKKND